jgi:lipopolysaccharide export system protein LptC
MALMIALALGSFWVLEVLRRSGSDIIPTAPRTEPDFYVEKFSYVKMSKTGEASYHMSGAKLTHNPQDDSYDIQQPVMHKMRDNNQPPMTARADRARVDSDNTKVHMYDNVHIDRPASPTEEPLHIQSEYMLLLPDEDVMQTDKPVQITFGLSQLTGTGMFANNATRELRLSSNVHGTYQVPAR